MSGGPFKPDEYIKEAFLIRGGGRGGKDVLGTVPNLEIIRQSPIVRSMAGRIADLAINATPEQVDIGMRYYPNERANLRRIGEGFNENRQRRGLTTYFPDSPELAGALLSGQFSANNSEAGRRRLVEQARTTGELGGHLSTPRIEQAIREGTHPMDLAASQYGNEGLKLYDYSGSQLFPETWSGEWRGVRRGMGYTIDRHSNDLAYGYPFGDSNRGLDTRRYRTLQVAHHLAHGAVASEVPHMSAAQFQAVPWVAWRGTHDLLS